MLDIRENPTNTGAAFILHTELNIVHRIAEERVNGARKGIAVRKRAVRFYKNKQKAVLSPGDITAITPV